ncbi:unnamed protein product [Caretta caretta]
MEWVHYPGYLYYNCSVTADVHASTGSWSGYHLRKQLLCPTLPHKCGVGKKRRDKSCVETGQMVMSGWSRTFYPQAKCWSLGRNVGFWLLDRDKPLEPKLLTGGPKDPGRKVN